MVTSIANSLGFGSGLDLPKLVSDLAAASRDPKVARFDKRTAAVQASISAVAQARANLEGFANSLNGLVTGASLLGTPTISDPTALDVKVRPGARTGPLTSAVEVIQLARGQTSASGYIAAASDPVGQGTLTITSGARTTNIVIDASNDSLSGLAAAINASSAGVSANVVTDAQGARIVLKGATGSAAAFSLSSNDAGLATFAGGVTTVQAARDAQLRVDGLDYLRGSNTVDDIVPGLSLTLKKPTTDAVSVAVTRDAATFKTTLQDFVSVYNELKGQLNEARTATRNDAVLRNLDQQLARLIAQPVSSGTPASLSSIGVSTNRDGTITLDAAKFDAAFAANPEGVEALFIPVRDGTRNATTDPGIGGALNALRTAAANQIGSLSSRLSKESQALAKDRDAMEAREAIYRARLEKQFGGLDSRLGALKATQSYLDQQIKLWSKSD